MNKKEVISKLKELKNNSKNKYAEIVCDISRGGQIVYPNETIIVKLGRTGSAIRGTWCGCNSITEFDNGVVYGNEEDARKAYCSHYVSDFKDIKTL